MATPDQAIRQLREVIDRFMPGATRETALTPHGFGVVAQGGLVLVMCDSEDPWFFSATAGLAQSVADVQGALAWANEKNTGHRFGRYYASLPSEGVVRANLVYQVNVFSPPLSDSYRLLMDNIVAATRLCTDIVHREAAEAVSVVGGAAFDDTSECLTLLFAASLG